MDYFDYEVVCQIRGSLSNYDEASDCISKYVGCIYHDREPDLRPKKIGKIRLYRLNAKLATDHGLSLLHACDDESEGLLDYYKAFFQYPSNELKSLIQKQFDVGSPDVLILDACILAPKYRGLGLGLLALRRSMDMLAGGCGLVACLPCPMKPSGEFRVPPQFLTGFGPNEKKMGRSKLQRYWEQLGFRPAGRSGYYALSMTQKHPTLDELIDMLEGRISQ